MRMRKRAVALTAVFVLGQVAAATHLALVAHVTCPEHGEVIHQAPRARDHHPERAGVSAASARGHDHDVCSLALHRSFASARPAAVESAAPVRLAAQRPIERALPSSGRYRLAPKTSPPA